MSFLNRLQLKQQGQLPTVQPCVPSRFESLVPMGQDTVLDTPPEPTFSRPRAREDQVASNPMNGHDPGTKESGKRQDAQNGDTLSVKSKEYNEPQVPFVDLGKDATATTNSHDEAAFSVTHTVKKIEGILKEPSYFKGGINPNQNGIQEAGNLRSGSNSSVITMSGSKGTLDMAEKTVTVNIGTVEVRAIMEERPNTPKKVAARKPKVSLQEYLETKNKRS